MRSVEVWARILAGFGSLVAVGLILGYGFGWLVGGAPDEQVPVGVGELLVCKAIVVGIAAIALMAGAVTARARVIISGCWLFVADFVLLLILQGLVSRPRVGHVEGGSSSIPAGIVLTVLVIWIAFPVLTMRLAARAAAGR